MGVGYFCVLYGWMDAGWLSSKRWHAYPDLYFLVYVKKINVIMSLKKLLNILRI